MLDRDGHELRMWPYACAAVKLEYQAQATVQL
eukprot:SAG11_NODE_3350_length_2507_cov_3.084302_7_plen_32_part_00